MLMINVIDYVTYKFDLEIRLNSEVQWLSFHTKIENPDENWNHQHWIMFDW